MSEKKLTLYGGQPTGAPPKSKDRETYFISQTRNGKLVAIKIGLASPRKSDRRLRQLRTGNPDHLAILLVIPDNVENRLHRQFAKHRIIDKATGRRTEWFEPAKEILDLIDNLKKVQELVKRVENHHR